MAVLFPPDFWSFNIRKSSRDTLLDKMYFWCNNCIMNNYMEVFTVFFPKTPQFHEIVSSSYDQGKGSRVTYALRKEQQEMIDAIAEYTGNTTVETLRRIIDDWKQKTLNSEVAVK